MFQKLTEIKYQVMHSYNITRIRINIYVTSKMRDFQNLKQKQKW